MGCFARTFVLIGGLILLRAENGSFYGLGVVLILVAFFAGWGSSSSRSSSSSTGSDTEDKADE